MGSRRNQRVSTSLPVRIFGTDTEGKPFARLVHTVDVSTSGARIGGIYVSLRAGDVIGLQRGTEKGRFRVAWTGKMGTRNAGEIGIMALDTGKQIWGMSLPEGGEDPYRPKASWTERRRHFRFDCDFGVELRTNIDSPGSLVRCTDISRGGCYLETWSPLPVTTKTFLLIKLPTGNVHATGEVRTADPGFGMGVRFTNVESTTIFDEFIQELHLRLNPAPPETSAFEPALPASAECWFNTQSSLDPPTPRILLAEDSRFLRSAYALYLRRENYQVITADDGDQTLKLAAIECPDVIVLDLLMPRLGGVGALKMLKEDPATASIPVIVLSGLPSSNESKLVDCGAFAYLAKTQVGPEDLPKHVRRALELKARPLLPQAEPDHWEQQLSG
jgi:CheY-like chemotaxis protein